MTTRDTPSVSIRGTAIIFLHCYINICLLNSCRFVFTGTKTALIFLTSAQLNHAARHRNVYYDTVGGDPYGERGRHS